MLPRNPEWFEMDALAVDNILSKEWIRQAVPILKVLEFSIYGTKNDKVGELLKFASERWDIGDNKDVH
jgi:hypothetical protein